MNRIAIPTLAVATALLALSGSAYARSSSTNQNSMNSKAQLVLGSAELNHAIDTDSATAGQTVTAKLTSTIKLPDGTKLHGGTMLIGNVTMVQAANNNTPAKLTLTFDKAQPKNGTAIPIKATLLEVAPRGSEISFPLNVNENSKYIQEPGVLHDVSMRSAVDSNVSGTLTSKTGNINLHQGTEFQLAITPQSGAMNSQSGS